MLSLEERRKIVKECYNRHGHDVVEWRSHSAVPVKMNKTREDAVCGAKVWAAAAMELGGGPKKAR